MSAEPKQAFWLLHSRLRGRGRSEPNGITVEVLLGDLCALKGRAQGSVTDRSCSFVWNERRVASAGGKPTCLQQIELKSKFAATEQRSRAFATGCLVPELSPTGSGSIRNLTRVIAVQNCSAHQLASTARTCDVESGYLGRPLPRHSVKPTFEPGGK